MTWQRTQLVIYQVLSRLALLKSCGRHGVAADERVTGERETFEG